MTTYSLAGGLFSHVAPLVGVSVLEAQWPDIGIACRQIRLGREVNGTVINLKKRRWNKETTVERNPFKADKSDHSSPSCWPCNG